MPKNIAVLDQTGHKIINLGAPTLPNDATTKLYVDALYNNLDYKQSVRGVMTTNSTLTGTLTDDGVVYVTGNRILLVGQTVPAENGIYVINTAGAWSRAEDYNVDSEVTSGSVIPVSEGTVGAGRVYKLATVDPIVVGTTPLTFSEFGAVPANVAKFHRQTIVTTGGAETIVVTHNLGNTNVGVTIKESAGQVVLADIGAFTTNTLSVIFDALTPAAASYDLFIVG